MDEFEEMRRQLASMKLQLDTQQIVNNNLMRKVMRGRTLWMNVFVKAELIALPIVYLMFIGICYIFGLSQWFSFTYLLFGGIDAVLDLRTVRIPAELFSSSSILDLKRFLVRQKKERFIQTCISGAICVIWIILFGCAMAISNSNPFPDGEIVEASMEGGLVGCIIGAVAGVVCVILLYRKMQNTNDRILADIDTLESERRI